MKTRPSAKIFALSFAAILIVGSAVYLKFLSPVAKNQNATLEYHEGTTSVPNIDPVALALQNELLKPPTPETAFVNPNFAEGDNLTDRFSKSTFASYMSLQNVGAGDTASQEGVIEAMVNRASTIQTADKYSISQINTFVPENKQAMRDYGNSFSQIIQDPLKDIAKNPKKYKDLAAFAVVYEKIAADLIALSAPTELADAHLKMANFYYTIAQGYRAVNKYSDDPLKAMLAIKDIKSIDEEKALKVYVIFANYFKENGILFTKDEAGYGWTGEISN